MGKFIPLSVPNLKGNEKKYVSKAIEDEWVSTGGASINAFENVTAEYNRRSSVSERNGGLTSVAFGKRYRQRRRRHSSGAHFYRRDKSCEVYRSGTVLYGLRRYSLHGYEKNS